jgi:hypothetical protein
MKNEDLTKNFRLALLKYEKELLEEEKRLDEEIAYALANN